MQFEKEGRAGESKKEGFETHFRQDMRGKEIAKRGEEGEAKEILQQPDLLKKKTTKNRQSVRKKGGVSQRKGRG